MINLRNIIDRIQVLLDENSEQSVTYAALEARLALEKVCYDRLRQRHDYISHAQLRRWQPGAIVNTLMIEVDPHVAQGCTLSMSRNPVIEGMEPDADDYVEIGTEVGFDAKAIAKMWQALANLALHVRLPKNKSDRIPDYGNREKVRDKVIEVVAELERLAKGTMSFSGVPIGGDVSFECRCGEKNRRRASLLTSGQSIFCINPDCMSSWQVEIDGKSFSFVPETVDVDCSECGAKILIDRRHILAMKYDQTASFRCHACSSVNYVRWQLMQARKVDEPAADEPSAS